MSKNKKHDMGRMRKHSGRQRQEVSKEQQNALIPSENVQSCNMLGKKVRCNLISLPGTIGLIWIWHHLHADIHIHW